MATNDLNTGQLSGASHSSRAKAAWLDGEYYDLFPEPKPVAFTSSDDLLTMIQKAAEADGGSGSGVRGLIDVTDHGVNGVPNLDASGASDVSANLLALIEALPDDTGLRDDYIGWAPPTLYFPSYQDATTPAEYRFDSTCVLPGSHNFRITSDAPFGARFVNNTGTDYIFEFALDSVGRNKSISNVFFDGGGIYMNGRVRGLVEIYHCAFRDCADWSIWFGNEGGPDYLGPVGPYVHDCYIMDSGGINVDTDTYLIIRLERIRFFRVTTESVRIDGPGVFVYDCDFQEMEKTIAQTRGHIHIASSRGTASDIRIINNRWGVEGDGVATDVPKWAITIGESSTPVDVTSALCGSIFIQGNRFGGRSSSLAADANHGQAAMGLFGRVSGLIFVQNVVINHADVVIDEDYFVNNAGGSATSGGVTCVYGWNADQNHTVSAGLPVFKNGGYAFKHNPISDSEYLHTRDSDGGKYELAIYGGDANGALGWGGEGILLNAYNDPTRKFRLRISSGGVVDVQEETSATYTAMADGPVTP